jgi:hypothetical protein
MYYQHPVTADSRKISPTFAHYDAPSSSACYFIFPSPYVLPRLLPLPLPLLLLLLWLLPRYGALFCRGTDEARIIVDINKWLNK